MGRRQLERKVRKGVLELSRYDTNWQWWVRALQLDVLPGLAEGVQRRALQGS